LVVSSVSYYQAEVESVSTSVTLHACIYKHPLEFEPYHTPCSECKGSGKLQCDTLVTVGGTF